MIFLVKNKLKKLAYFLLETIYSACDESRVKELVAYLISII